MKAWLKAARPLAQVNIAVPLLLGQALAFAQRDRFDPWTALLVHGWGLADHLFIVFANDWADRDNDRVNRTWNLFSGGSRVLPLGLLSPRALGLAAIGALVLLLVLSAWGALWVGPVFAGAGIAAALLLWAYSFPPIRLSYRGQGELLQALGVGVVLPLLGYGAQAGGLDGFPWAALAPSFLAGYAGNLTTALPDAPSDAAGDKRTWAVRHGEKSARVTSVLFLALAAVTAAMVSPLLRPGARLLIGALPIAILAFNVPLLDRADASDRRACFRFVFTNGLAAQALLLGWAALLLWA